MIVQVGSNANIDSATTSAGSGRAQARIFNVAALRNGTSSVAYLAGELFAYGLRNSIGWGEEPTTGGIVNSHLNIRLKSQAADKLPVVSREFA